MAQLIVNRVGENDKAVRLSSVSESYFTLA